MTRKLIAIVGSADEHRSYSPPLSSVSEIRAAGEELGRELAKENCDIVVYSGEEGFIEASVVRGYVAHGQIRPKSIQVRHPIDAGVIFPELLTDRQAFDLQPDVSPDWEVSFYRSLPAAHGVVMLGGGRSTLVTGLIALAYRLPVVPVATFGGDARKVWEALSRDKGLASSEEISSMAQPWDQGSAARLVGALLAAHARRVEQDREAEGRAASYRRRVTLSSLVAAFLLTFAVLAIPVSWNWKRGSGGALAALFVTPLFAGAAGAIIRLVFDRGQDWTKTAVMGLSAGGVAVLLFVAAQVAATPDILESGGSRNLLLFALPMSFIAGLTFDTVYENLRKRDALKSPSAGGEG